MKVINQDFTRILSNLAPDHWVGKVPCAKTHVRKVSDELNEFVRSLNKGELSRQQYGQAMAHRAYELLTGGCTLNINGEEVQVPFPRDEIQGWAELQGITWGDELEMSDDDRFAFKMRFGK